MISLKVKFRPSAVEGREGVVFYQIIKNRTVRQVSTGCRLLACEWDVNSSTVILPTAADGRRDRTAKVAYRIRHDVDTLAAIIRRREDSGTPFTADDVVADFKGRTAGRTFAVYMLDVITALRRYGRRRTSEAYTSALSSFMAFRGGHDVMPGEVDADLMSLYEAWLHSRGVCSNTVSFYMRILRAVYNRAVDDGLTPQRNPFRHVYTGVDKTLKRAVSLTVVRRIMHLDLHDSPRLDFARDMFFFSFYMRGMSFVDMAFLRKSDLAAGFVTYRRRKTGQRLVIKWEKCMQAIVDKYDTAGSPYLLPIIGRSDTDPVNQYRNSAYMVNKYLKIIGAMVGCPVKLTTYVARHTWASIARNKHIAVGVISEAMGHDSEKTTRIYLASLDTAVVDKANKIVIDSL